MSTYTSNGQSAADGQGARPTGELVKDLTEQVSTLVRDEMELARVELAAKGKQAGAGAGMLGAAGVIALLGAGALVAAAILALATAMKPWLAAVIVGVALLAVAGMAALMGKSRVRRAVPPAPQEAIASAREDVQAAGAAIREARS
jgi:uncharacterized membrane protein YqjE